MRCNEWGEEDELNGEAPAGDQEKRQRRIQHDVDINQRDFH